jgi:predicted dehydrogenase
VVAVTSRRPSSARSLCDDLAARGCGGVEVHETLHQLTDDDRIEAVLVGVPIHRTAPVAERVLRSGKHVLVEKPVADSLDDARRLRDTAREAGVVLAVAENFRYQRDYHEVHDLITSGLIGAPLLYFLNDLHITEVEPGDPATLWRRAGLHRGGYLVDGGVHLAAAMRTMVGRDVEQVHAVGASFHPERLAGPFDTLLMNLRFSGDLVGHLALGYGAFDIDTRQPRVYGDAGTLIIRPKTFELCSSRGTEQVGVRTNASGVEEEWSHFLDAVQAQCDWEHAFREATVDLAIILAGWESAQTASVVDPEVLLARADLQ